MWGLMVAEVPKVMGNMKKVKKVGFIKKYAQSQDYLKKNTLFQKSHHQSQRYSTKLQTQTTKIKICKKCRCNHP